MTKLKKLLIFSSSLFIPTSLLSCNNNSDPDIKKPDEDPYEDGMLEYFRERAKKRDADNLFHEKISEDTKKEQLKYVVEKDFITDELRTLSATEQNRRWTEKPYNWHFFGEPKYWGDPVIIKIRTLEDFNNLIINNAKKSKTFHNYQDENKIKELFETTYLGGESVDEVLSKSDIYIFELGSDYNLIRIKHNDIFFVYGIKNSSAPKWNVGVTYYDYSEIWKVMKAPKYSHMEFKKYDDLDDIIYWYNDVFLPETKKTGTE